MRIVLFRHGIAIDRADPRCPPDPQRALTPQGVRRTRRAAKGLQTLGVAPELILTSPYVRAAQTAEIVAEVLDIEAARIETREDLVPFGDPRRLLGSLPKECEEVLCVGHNPQMSDLLSVALGEQARSVASLKKAGAACLDLEEPGRRPGHLVWLLEPKALRRLGDAPAQSD